MPEINLFEHLFVEQDVYLFCIFIFNCLIKLVLFLSYVKNRGKRNLEKYSDRKDVNDKSHHLVKRTLPAVSEVGTVYFTVDDRDIESNDLSETLAF